VWKKHNLDFIEKLNKLVQIIIYTGDDERTQRGVNKSVGFWNKEMLLLLNRRWKRLISLVESLYKLLAKVLLRRLGKVMDSIVAKNQSAFLKEISLADGVVVVMKWLTLLDVQIRNEWLSKWTLLRPMIR
jgi:hypothetical protein